MSKLPQQFKPQEQIVFEGEKIESQVLTNSIINWKKEIYDQSTRRCGSMMTDHDDEEIQGIKSEE